MWVLVIGLVALSSQVVSCQRSSQISAERAKGHVALLAKVVAQDLEEVRLGLPKGSDLLKRYYEEPEREDALRARDALDLARGKVQDLRVAKSTFFALTDDQGKVIRNDRDQDLMAGKNLLAPFPKLSEALRGRHVETRGSWKEASAVLGREDGQWVAAEPVKSDGKVVGLYVTGWSWSAYAYRLENHLRGNVRSELSQNDKEPLLYVFVVVEKKVFGAPVSPDVNRKVVADRDFISDPSARNGPVSAETEITGRDFGMAFVRVPGLGDGVGLAVLRSET